jgi:hypothetical protein
MIGALVRLRGMKALLKMLEDGCFFSTFDDWD